MDALQFLILYFAGPPHLGGLRGFYEDYREYGPQLAAVGGRARWISSSALSRLLSSVNASMVEDGLRWLLLEGAGALPLMRAPGMQAVDALGQPWHLFDFDPSRRAMRQRALEDAAELPEPRRRLNHLARPGYPGRKRGELVGSEVLVQHAGSGIWLGCTVQPGNGDPREHCRAAVDTVARALDRMETPRAAGCLRSDGEFGTVPCLTLAKEAGIAFLTRISRYELLALPEVQARLERATWERVGDSGSGPTRFAADLGEVRLTASAGTVRRDGTPYAPVVTRVIVSRAVGARRGAGTPMGDERVELFAALGLPSEAWPPAAVVEGYYGRVGQENRFAQLDREFAVDATFSERPEGQMVALTAALLVWNLQIVRAGVPGTPAMLASTHRPGAAAVPPLVWPESRRVEGPETGLAANPPSTDTPSERSAPREAAAPEPEATSVPTGTSVPEEILKSEEGKPEARARRVTLLTEAGFPARVARRPGYRWNTADGSIVDANGHRLTLRAVEPGKLRFASTRRRQQATFGISLALSDALRRPGTVRDSTPAPVGRRPSKRETIPQSSALVGPHPPQPPDRWTVAWPSFRPARARDATRKALEVLRIDITLTGFAPRAAPVAHRRPGRISLAERTNWNALSSEVRAVLETVVRARKIAEP
ncbi:MAG: hypothetical protein FJ102_25240 [Deltaproteobacteria bacterium]|nr:hypothetical protein [Deltaproteobacteria bacterium]